MKLQSPTALELVNDVLTLHRYTPVTDVTEAESPEGAAALLLINQAIDQVLNGRAWDFATRHDGILATEPPHTEDGTVTVTSGGAVYTPTDSDADDWLDPICPYIQLTDASTGTNTAYKVWTVSTVGGLVGLTTTHRHSGLDWSQASAVNLDMTVLFPEYKLPDTVSSVLSVRVQETPVTVRAMPDSPSLDELIPRWHETSREYPDYVVVGGVAHPPTHSTSGTPDPGLRMLVYPYPSTSYDIHYSYVYEWQQLDEASDTVPMISSAARHSLVHHASAQMNLTTIGNNPELGRFQRAQNDHDTNKVTSKSNKKTGAYRSVPRPFSTSRVRRRSTINETITGP